MFTSMKASDFPFAACAAFLAAQVAGSGVAWGQTDDVFTLYIEGPSELNGAAEKARSAADANDDGAVDPSDAVFLIDYQFQPGMPSTPFPAPSAPFPGCGTDPTDDTVDCAESQAICS